MEWNMLQIMVKNGLRCKKQSPGDGDGQTTRPARAYLQDEW